VLLLSLFKNDVVIKITIGDFDLMDFIVIDYY
jgi:hypothetical protein